MAPDTRLHEQPPRSLKASRGMLTLGLVALLAIGAMAQPVGGQSESGEPYVWGWNYHGQLGDGTKTTRYLPVRLDDIRNITMMRGGYGHTVALRSDGTVWAWGDNLWGQLGNGTTTDSTTAVKNARWCSKARSNALSASSSCPIDLK